MVVEGTEQRIYGYILPDNLCTIDLDRFALVYGSTEESPLTTSHTIYYGSESYELCGYKKGGFVTMKWLRGDEVSTSFSYFIYFRSDPTEASTLYNNHTLRILPANYGSFIDSSLGYNIVCNGISKSVGKIHYTDENNVGHHESSVYYNMYREFTEDEVLYLQEQQRHSYSSLPSNYSKLYYANPLRNPGSHLNAVDDDYGPGAVVELRMCNRNSSSVEATTNCEADPPTIVSDKFVIETYGESKLDEPASIWYLKSITKKTAEELLENPTSEYTYNWVRVNKTVEDGAQYIFPETKIACKFSETRLESDNESTSVVTLPCCDSPCKKCNCVDCDIYHRLRFSFYEFSVFPTEIPGTYSTYSLLPISLNRNTIDIVGIYYANYADGLIWDDGSTLSYGFNSSNVIPWIRGSCSFLPYDPMAAYTYYAKFALYNLYFPSFNIEYYLPKNKYDTNSEIMVYSDWTNNKYFNIAWEYTEETINFYIYTKRGYSETYATIEYLNDAHEWITLFSGLTSTIGNIEDEEV